MTALLTPTQPTPAAGLLTVAEFDALPDDVVLVADPFTQTVRVFADDRTETLTAEMTLGQIAAMPGFEVPVADLFA